MGKQRSQPSTNPHTGSLTQSGLGRSSSRLGGRRSRGSRERRLNSTVRHQVSQQIDGEAIQLFSDRLVATLQEVVGMHGGNGHGQTQRGHDQSFTDRTGNGVDRGLTGSADLDERAIDADNRTEQTDERRGRTDGREERQTAAQLRVDRGFRTGKRTVQPVMCFDRIGQLGVFFLSLNTVIDDLLVGRVLFKLGRTFLEGRGAPEGCTKLLALIGASEVTPFFGRRDLIRPAARNRLNSSRWLH